MEEKKSKKKLGKLVFLLSFFTVLIVGSGLLFNNHAKEKIAEEFLVQEAKNYSKIIELVNDLSMDKTFDRSLKDLRVSTKKAENELEKVKKVLDKINETQDKNKKRELNKKISEVDIFLDNFYKDLKREVEEYELFLIYQIEDNEIALNFAEEDDKLDKKKYDKKTEGLKDDEELLKKVVEEIKTLNPPERLKDEVTRKVKLLGDRASILEKARIALENKNDADYRDALNEYDKYWEEYDKETKKVSEVAKAYFELLGDKFSSLNKKADKIRSMMISKKVEFDVRISSIEIEVW